MLYFITANGWIEVAKRPETRERRIRESILLLQEGKKLGLR
ncbi:MAG: YdeI/OmpD-associated family protein [bacterium]